MKSITPSAGIVPVDLTTRARQYQAESRADATIRAYRSDWQSFTAWCRLQGRESLPASPNTLYCYITDLAESHKASTIQRKLVAIGQAHVTAGYPNPTHHTEVRTTMAGIRRAKTMAPAQKAAIRAQSLRPAIVELPETISAIRNKALILVGYAGAFRRSELVSLDVSDVTFTEEGIILRIGKSKTDQEGEGMEKTIARGNSGTCPVVALREWLDRAEITEGPIFRPINRHGSIGKTRLTAQSVALVCKKLAPSLGLDPKDVGGHSLRAGLVTDLYKAGTPEATIMAVSGHKSRQVLGRYRREAEQFAFDQVRTVGL